MMRVTSAILGASLKNIYWLKVAWSGVLFQRSSAGTVLEICIVEGTGFPGLT
jgi:hypothetical protein